MTNWRILNTLDLTGAPEAVAAIEEVGELVSLPPERDHVLKNIADFDVYFASAKVRVDPQFLDAARRLKLIGTPSTGTDHLDIEEIGKRGVACMDIATEYELINSFTATSELSFGLLLSLVRKIPAALRVAREGEWARERFTGFQLSQKTLGILGLGRLGRITARIGQGFGMRVIGHDIRDVSVDGVENVSFDELLQNADVLSIHIHLTPATEGLIGRAEFAKMKRTAILLNTSRGRIIDEVALLAALQGNKLAGAGLDVIDGEWLTQQELLRHPLILYSRKYENLLISPHIGGMTTESIYGARVFMAQRIAEWIMVRSSVE